MDFTKKIDEHSLERAKPYMHLGVDLDESLSRVSHLHNIGKIVSAGLGAIIRVRNLFPRETLIMIYKALTQPCFDNYSSGWGSLGVCQSERLQTLKNRPLPYNERQLGHWLARNLIHTKQKLGLGDSKN